MAKISEKQFWDGRKVVEQRQLMDLKGVVQDVFLTLSKIQLRQSGNIVYAVRVYNGDDPFQAGYHSQITDIYTTEVEAIIDGYTIAGKMAGDSIPKASVRDEPLYDVLSPYIGSVVTAVRPDDNGILEGVLTIFQATNGNEGWLVGTFPEGPYSIFTYDAISKIEPLPLLGSITLHLR